jgi:hypothetical protein
MIQLQKSTEVNLEMKSEGLEKQISNKKLILSNFKLERSIPQTCYQWAQALKQSNIQNLRHAEIIGQT